MPVRFSYSRENHLEKWFYTFCEFFSMPANFYWHLFCAGIVQNTAEEAKMYRMSTIGSQFIERDRYTPPTHNLADSNMLQSQFSTKMKGESRTAKEYTGIVWKGLVENVGSLDWYHSNFSICAAKTSTFGLIKASKTLIGLTSQKHRRRCVYLEKQ